MMPSSEAAPMARRPSRKLWVWALVGACLSLLVGANAHLVYVAFTSQPDCVPHAKGTGENGAPLRAARSAC